ncbi:hypothetical protein GA0115253_102548, partial [Streptomyces sp. Termitarium-T10T-6]
MTSTTAPTSVETVARPQNMASTRLTGKPSTVLERTTTPPAPYASARPGIVGAADLLEGDRAAAFGVGAGGLVREELGGQGRAVREVGGGLVALRRGAEDPQPGGGPGAADLGEGVEEGHQVLGGLDP